MIKHIFSYVGFTSTKLNAKLIAVKEQECDISPKIRLSM